MQDAQVLVELDGPLDLVATCRPLTDGGSDPTWDIAPGGVRRALSTPEGPTTVEAVLESRGLRVRGVGPGADWAVQRCEVMFGIRDDRAGFRPELHPTVGHLARRRPGARFGASLRIWDALVPVVLGQRVTVGEARRSWWRLVRRHGSPAPGADDLFVGPSPATLCRLGTDEWHRIGVDRGRAESIVRAARILEALERAASQGSAEFQRVITTVRGIGPWTATALASTVLGDPDAVLLGDLHLPDTVAWALAGEARGDDARMLELLEPWRGHRGRVVRLLVGSGRGAPKRGPRYTPIPMERW